MTARRIVLSLVLTLVAEGLAACVPSGNAPPYDAGPPVKIVHDSPGAITSVFEEDFENIVPGPPLSTTLPPVLLPEAGASGDAGGDGGDAAVAFGIDAALPLAIDGGDAGEILLNPLGPNWQVTAGAPTVWHIEKGMLCGQGALNRGVWLKKILPVNARIEFDAVSDSADGDLKAEVWGDGKSGATASSYTNATSYIAVLGGWKNTVHVLARKNEHGKDRKEIKIDKDSDDPREHPVSVGQTNHIKIERSDGKTVHFSVNGIELMKYEDPDPLAGVGHDHLGFNNYWDTIKSCYDNVKITPL